jgi:subtilase family serine protease
MASSPPKTLTGHVPDIVAQGHAHLVGHHPATDHLTLTIGLHLRNKQALDQFLSEVSDPTNPQYRHYMTQAEANQAFNPTSQQEQQVATWLRVNGLKVINTYPNHLLLDTSGTFGQVEHMLHLTLNDYTTTVQGKQIAFYAPANEPTVDGSVSGIVESIVGLDNYPRFHGDTLPSHPATNGNPDNTPPYYPQDFANAYDVNPLWNAGAIGTGQNIGITLG